MDVEFDECVSLLEQILPVLFKITDIENKCDFCGKKNQKVWDIFGYDDTQICFCLDCKNKILHCFSQDLVTDKSFRLVERKVYCHKEKFKTTDSKSSFSFDPPDDSWTETTSNPTLFLSRLKEKHRGFAKRLSDFSSGEVQLNDGSQHPLLQSIANQVLDGLKMPTQKQVSAFVGIFDKLQDKKRSGSALTLESSDDKAKRKNASEKLVNIARKHYSKFPGAKTQSTLLSFVKQFDEKGILTEKQIKYLRFIVEQLPASLLRDFE